MCPIRGAESTPVNRVRGARVLCAQQSSVKKELDSGNPNVVGGGQGQHGISRYTGTVRWSGNRDRRWSGIGKNNCVCFVGGGSFVSASISRRDAIVVCSRRQAVVQVDCRRRLRNQVGGRGNEARRCRPINVVVR